MSEDLEHLENAIALCKKIARKVDDLLEPLSLEMKIMNWAPEFQSILWETVMLKAKRRLEAVDTTVTPRPS